MASIVVAGDTSGTVTLAAPAVSGTTTLTLPTTTGNVVADTATQTLTNKTLTSPTIATPTITGQATIPTINLTGGQITFPATQIPSADANTLDDYEEGTWTPTGNGVTLTGAAGWYTKIGNVVLVGAGWGYPTTANTSAAQVSGLPFTALSIDDNYMGCVPLTNYGSDNLYIATSVGTTTILVRNSGNTDLTNANLSNRFVKFMAIYKV